MFSKKIRLDNQGKTLSVATALVLTAINEIMEEENRQVYGYQIMQHLREKFNWNVKSGTVYPILKKLKKEGLIKQGIPSKTDSNRQQIFYSITERGKKLVSKIQSLNNEALESALGPTITNSKLLNEENVFHTHNFTDTYLSPMIIEYDKRISQLINNSEEQKDLNEIKEEILKSLEKIDFFKQLLQNQVDRIDQFQKIKK